MTWIPSYKKYPEPYLKIVTWADGTDEEIKAMVDAHYAGLIDLTDYWAVGDERTVSLSAMSATGVGESHVAQDVIFVLSNKGGKTLADGTTECAFQVDQKGVLKEDGYMNSTNTNNGGWNYSARRAWCNSVYYNAIPSSIRSIFKQHKNYYGYSGNQLNITTDYFALRAESEVCGTTGYSVSGEGDRIEWYKTQSNQYKYKTGASNSSQWWWRSATKNDSRSFVHFDSYGSPNSLTANATIGIAPFGVI